MSDSKKNQPEKKKRAQDDGWEERVKEKGDQHDQCWSVCSSNASLEMSML